MARPRKLEDQEQVNVRLPRDLVARLERQTKRTQAALEGFTISRADVLRLALARGLEVLEAERRQQKGNRKGNPG